MQLQLHELVRADVDLPKMMDDEEYFLQHMQITICPDHPCANLHYLKEQRLGRLS